MYATSSSALQCAEQCYSCPVVLSCIINLQVVELPQNHGGRDQLPSPLKPRSDAATSIYLCRCLSCSRTTVCATSCATWYTTRNAYNCLLCCIHFALQALELSENHGVRDQLHSPIGCELTQRYDACAASTFYAGARAV
jgi:hypothetical protein